MMGMMFTGCKKEEMRPYYWNVEVRNETNRQISLTQSDKNGKTISDVKIASGQTGTLTGILHYGPENVVKLTDPLKWDEDVPFNEVHRSFSFNIGATPNPMGIWSRKHWGFKGDFYDYTYTLTVTEKFLNENWPTMFDDSKK